MRNLLAAIYLLLPASAWADVMQVTFLADYRNLAACTYDHITHAALAHEGLGPTIHETLEESRSIIDQYDEAGRRYYAARFRGYKGGATLVTITYPGALELVGKRVMYYVRTCLEVRP